MKSSFIFSVTLLALSSPTSAAPQISWSDYWSSNNSNNGADRCFFRCTTTAPTPSATAAPAPSTPSNTNAPTPWGEVPAGPPSSYNGGSTANDVTSKTGCRPLTLIFARGTGEAGNMGTVIGPPMAKALQSGLGAGGVSVQGVDYPADWAGNSNLGTTGGRVLVGLVNDVLQACPSTKIALSGYSQGAIVVHNALGNGVDGSKIAAVVAFGDPLARQPFQGVNTANVLNVCADGDTLCSGGGVGITPAHLTYGRNAQEAADFIRKAVGL